MSGIVVSSFLVLIVGTSAPAAHKDINSQGYRGLSFLQTVTHRVPSPSRSELNLTSGDVRLEPSTPGQIPVNETGYSSLLVEVFRIPEKIYNSIARDVTYDNVWEEILTFPERRPRVFNVMLATFKTWFADVIVQLSERSRASTAGAEWSFDWRRSSAFAVFGCVYIGLIQWMFYISIFSMLCPNAIRFANEPWDEKVLDHAGRVDLVKQVCYDNFMLETLIYFPIFYVVKEVMRAGRAGFNAETARNGLLRYLSNFKEDNMACWAVWVPADFAIFAAPMWMRMPLDHLVSFGWTMLLSHLRGGASCEKEKLAEKAATA
jgi:hypothetical protein